MVWDNGLSIDLQGLHKLWWIARSPKNVGDRTATSGGRTRAMIGKFGIGKLASYAVGHRISHVCRRDGRFLLVGVDYRSVPALTDGEEGSGSVRRHSTAVVELTEREAHEHVSALFSEAPQALEALWTEPHWTLAVIDDLKEDVRLTEGRLSWNSLGNGMPLRPDFQVFVNDAEVESKLAKDGVVSWGPLGATGAVATRRRLKGGSQGRRSHGRTSARGRGWGGQRGRSRAWARHRWPTPLRPLTVPKG